MPTTIPPAANELVDGEAMWWLYNNGYLFPNSCMAPVQPVFRDVQKAQDFMDKWAGNGTLTPANGSPYPTWGEVNAWRLGAQNYPCNTAPTINAANSSRDTPGGRVYEIKIDWTNPANADSNWRIRILRSTDTGVTKNYTQVHEVAVNGANLAQQWIDTGVSVNVTYWYKAYYYVTDLRPTRGPDSNVSSATPV